MMTADTPQDLSAPSHIVSIHSELDGRPAMCGWAKSEAEAQEKIAEIKTRNPDAARATYWTVVLSKAQVLTYKDMGMLPADA